MTKTDVSNQKYNLEKNLAFRWIAPDRQLEILSSNLESAPSMGTSKNFWSG